MASAPSHSHQSSSYEYLDALLAVVPHDSTVPKEIELASPSRGGAYPKFIDTALRLASGGPPRPDDAPHLRDTWPEVQASVQRALHALHSHPLSSLSSPSRHQEQQQQQQQHTNKRKRSPPPPPPPSSSSKPPATTTKKPKYEGGDTGAAGAPDEEGHEEEEDDDDDDAQLTLHALSATAPVRHKVDITLHARTLRLAHSTTGAPKASCARTALTRAFLLPTRARSSGAMQWTVLLLAGDKPAPAPAPRRVGGRAGASAAAALRFELACSVPDSSSASSVPRMTMHASTSTSATAVAATTTTTTNARDTLLAFLSSTISGTTTPTLTLTTVERGTTPLAGITAFRGVRETSLWFFDGDGGASGVGAGILTDARPAEFWAIADLAPGDSGVRVRTATGRTCSVVLTRRPRRLLPRGNENDHGEDEDEEGEETEFQMIDGKERERILEWVRRYRGSFGITEEQVVRDEAQEAAAAAAATADGQGQEQDGDGEERFSGAGRGRGKGGAGRGRGRGDSDDSDSDFEVDSGDSDGGSPSGSSNSGSDAGSGEQHELGSKNEDAEDDEDEEDEDEDGVEELDPKHHPLLRANALLPKMSRAAMDDAVQLVMGDLLVGNNSRGGGLGQPAARRGGASASASGTSGTGPGPPPVAARDQDEQEHEDEVDDEEDELDD